jgi:2-polyprenyl-3-methyl-5-hydroxy-6-metoxy-1,4-benzoquinol methylase
VAPGESSNRRPRGAGASESAAGLSVVELAGSCLTKGARIAHHLLTCQRHPCRLPTLAKTGEPLSIGCFMSTSQSTECLICGGHTHVWWELPHIWHQPKGTRRYTIDWCDQCDFGFLQPRPSQQELNRFYGETYSTRVGSESKTKHPGQIQYGPTRRTFLDRVRVHIAWWLDRRRPLDAITLSRVVGSGPSRICDIGCGKGNLLADLKALGHGVVGVEVDENACRAAAQKGIEVFVGYAEALPDEIKGRSFDLVSMTHVLEHCADPLRALQNVAALLPRGGHLAVEVPNNDALLAETLGPCWFYNDAGRHLNFFTPKSLGNALKSLNFEIGEYRFSGYLTAFMNNRIAAEQSIWDLLYTEEDASLGDRPVRNSKRLQWMSLVRTLFAPPAKKYESIAIIARKGE